MIRLDKDPTLAALQRQTALQADGYYLGALDNWWGPKSQAAQEAWTKSFLRGDGSWWWAAQQVGEHIVIRDASVTWFGGDHDPLDNGETASGIKTKGNPNVLGIALPVIPGHSSTKGSPLAFGSGLKPGIPWRTGVLLRRPGYDDVMAELIDNGPAKSARDPVDATVKVFALLGGKISDGVIKGVDVRIIGAAKYRR